MAFQDLVAKLGFDITDWQQNVGKAQQSAEQLAGSMEKSFSGMADRLKSISQTLGSFSTGWSVAISAPLAALGTLAVTTSDKMATARIGFETMLGSAQKADAFIKELAAFAQRTPFDFPGLQAAAQRMLAMGFAANEVVPVLTAIGDAVGNLGGGQEKIDRIILALGQMSAKGRVMTQEMNQLTEAGVKAWTYLADAITKATGKVTTVADVMGMVEKRMLDGAAAARLIAIAMERDFAGGMEKASKLITGQLSNLRDAIVKPGGPLDQLGTAMRPIVLQWIADLSGLIPKVNALIGQFAALSPAAQKAIVEFGAVAVAIGPVSFALAKLAGLFSPLVSGIGSVIGALPALGKAFASVGTALGDTGLIGALTLGEKALLGFSGAAVAAGATLAGFKLTQWAREQSDALGDLVSGLVGAGGFLEALPRKFTELRAELQVGGGIFGALKKDAEENLAAIGRALSSVDEAIGGPFRRLKELLSSPLISGAFAQIWEGVKQGAREAGEFIQKAIDKVNELKALRPPTALEIQGTLANAPRPGAPGLTASQLAELARSQQALNAAVKAREVDELTRALLRNEAAAKDTAKEWDNWVKAAKKLEEARLLDALKRMETGIGNVGKAMKEAAAELAAGTAAFSSLAGGGQSAIQGGDLISDALIARANRLRETLRALYAEPIPEINDQARAMADLNRIIDSTNDFFGVQKGLVVDLGRIFNESFKGTGEKSIADLRAEAAKLGDTLGLIAPLLAKNPEALARMGIAQSDVNRLTLEYQQALLKVQDAELKVQLAAEGLTEAQRKALAQQIADTEKGIGQIDKLLATSSKVAEQTKSIWGDLPKETRRVFDSFINDMARAIVAGKNFQDAMKKMVEALEEMFVKRMLQGIFEPVLKAAEEKFFKPLANWLTQLFGGTGSSASAAADKASAAATSRGGGLGSLGAGGGGFLGVAGLVTGVVDAISGILGTAKLYNMERDIARVEVTTRGMLSQLIALQETLNNINANVQNIFTTVVDPKFWNVLYEKLGEITEKLTGMAGALLAFAGGVLGSGGGGDATRGIMTADLLEFLRDLIYGRRPAPADLTGGAGSGPRGGDVLPGAPNIPAAGGTQPSPEEEPNAAPPEEVVQGTTAALSALAGQASSLGAALDATAQNLARVGDKFVDLSISADKIRYAYDEEVARLSGLGSVSQYIQAFYRSLMEDAYGPMQRGTRQNPFGRTPEGSAQFVPPPDVYRPTFGPGGGFIPQGAAATEVRVNVSVQAQDPDAGYRIQQGIAQQARLNGFGI
jgi:tape measure domain-containing protein